MNAREIKALGSVWGAQDGLLSILELEALMAAMVASEPSTVLEVGHYCGLSTCAIVHALQRSGKDWEMFSVDAHIPDGWVQKPAAIATFEANRALFFDDPRLTAIYERSETIGRIDADFVFYDGDHHIEQKRFTRVVLDSPSVENFIFDDCDFDIPRECMAMMLAAGWIDKSPTYRRGPGDKLNEETQTLAWFARS